MKARFRPSKGNAEVIEPSPVQLPKGIRLWTRAEAAPTSVFVIP